MEVPVALAAISDGSSPLEVHLVPVGCAVEAAATWMRSQETGPSGPHGPQAGFTEVVRIGNDKS